MICSCNQVKSTLVRLCGLRGGKENGEAERGRARCCSRLERFILRAVGATGEFLGRGRTGSDFFVWKIILAAEWRLMGWGVLRPVTQMRVT